MSAECILVDQAAARSGLHPNTIQRLVRVGKLAGFKQKYGATRRWLVTVRSLDYYANPRNGVLLDLPGPKIYLQRRAGVSK